MKNIYTALVAVAALLMVTACSRLTEVNLQKVHNGMTTAEVKAILGEPTSSQTGSALGIISGTTYTYHTEHLRRENHLPQRQSHRHGGRI